MEDNLEIIEGFFTHTVYKSDNYMVARFKCEEGSITVTGPFFEYEEVQNYLLTGKYIDHPRYGLQFQISTIEKNLPKQKDGIISFLSSKSFPGIGKRTAMTIYEYFGDECLNILKNDPDMIFELPLSEKQLISLNEGFKKLDDPQNEILFHLISNGFSSLDAQKIFNRFKLATMEVSEDNPFRFYNEVNSMSFDKVRNYASHFEFIDADNKYREAFIIYLITEINFNTGDTYITYDNLLKALEKYGNMNNVDEIIERCLDHHYLIREEERLYLYDDYYDEIFISDYLKNKDNELKADRELIEEGILNCQNLFSIEYDDMQKKAISSFFENRISLIVGGPGTGKTTIVKTMVEMYRSLFPYNNLIVAAPTGRAAKRINEVCDVEAKTIHSLLRWNKETDTFVFNSENPIIYDSLIIDEFSMVDSNLFACLLKACSRVKKICIIGDDNQLPSIRPGFVLHDLIESEKFSLTRLTSNYRQKDGNEIIELCNDVISSDVDFDKYKKDVVYYDLHKNNVDLISLIQMDIDEGYSLDEIQVLSPMYKGEWGIDNLNILMQKTFNPESPDKKEKQAGKYLFREEDKILQLKNRPTDDVYNGDIGILKDIDLREKSLMVQYQDTFVFYNYDELSDIALAYSMSVHKSQGSEYPIIYFVATRNNLHMLNQNLIYTAVSRAKNKLVILSQDNILNQGVLKKMNRRKTTLKERICA
ncbi:MAG: AAA family ATPase [Erysipelotrichaceae bacterium]|nr:AAA family ATPase [Erysipelotrichaceae bacterium]